MADRVESDFIEPDVFDDINTQDFHPAGSNTRMNNPAADYSNPFFESGMETSQQADIVSDANPAMRRGTLDESIVQTLTKDVLDIFERLKLTFTPILGINVTDDEILDLAKSCDMWAPLLFIIFYSLCVSHGKSIFSTLFMFCWFVLLLMGLHLRLIEPTRKISLISYISLCGYPLSLQVVYSLISQLLLPVIFKVSRGKTVVVAILTLVELILLAGSVFASIKCSAFITRSHGFVQLFPLGVLYLTIGWIATVL
ncbi:protein Yip4p [Monosporozyma servazzii]